MLLDVLCHAYLLTLPVSSNYIDRYRGCLKLPGSCWRTADSASSCLPASWPLVLTCPHFPCFELLSFHRDTRTEPLIACRKVGGVRSMILCTSAWHKTIRCKPHIDLRPPVSGQLLFRMATPLAAGQDEVLCRLPEVQLHQVGRRRPLSLIGF